MAYSIRQFLAWDTQAIITAGEAAETAARIIDGALDEVVRSMDRPAHWAGDTHVAAGAKVEQERDHAHEVRNVLNRIADEAKDAGTDLSHACDYLRRIVTEAVDATFRVTDSGDVTHPDDSRSTEAKDKQRAIKAALATIADYDERYGTRLRELQSDLASMINGQPDIITPDLRPMDPDTVAKNLAAVFPANRRKYWMRLSPQDRRRVMQANPELIGNLDGIPFDDRIDANEVNIRNALADETQAGNGNGARAGMLREMLKQRNDPTIKAVADRDNDFGKDSADDMMTERKFISFKNTANGQYVEMIGSFGPTTRNAAVYVPGTGSNLNESGANYNSGWNMAKDSGGPVFVYMDGDLPQDIFAIHEGAADTRFAREMAPKLVDFGRELDTEISLHAPGAETTFIGHSYGGSVVGTAEQLGLRADRVVYASSAGTGVLDGGWHNANPHVQRYSMTAPGDLIGYLQDVPGNPHGDDPDEAPGVFHMDTGYYSDNYEKVEYREKEIEGRRGHGDYFNDRYSDAFENIVSVIKGDQPTPYVDRRTELPKDRPGPG